jgi:DNA-binding phage protein
LIFELRIDMKEAFIQTSCAPGAQFSATTSGALGLVAHTKGMAQIAGQAGLSASSFIALSVQRETRR